MVDSVAILVIGAQGFIGSNITNSLLRHQIKVRAFDIQFNLSAWHPMLETGLLELQEGSVFDEVALGTALQGVGVVVVCTSFSVPSTSPGLLCNELNTTVPAMDVVLASMVKYNVSKLFFLSSGGLIYGDTYDRPAKETDPLKPCCSYAVGKLICEEMIRFYAKIHGIQYYILRVSNVYGAVNIHRHSQGVVDVFLENVLLKKPLTVWGCLEHKRDYIFIDDLVEVFGLLLTHKGSESRTVNVGTGKSSSIRDVLCAIRKATKRRLEWNVDPTRYAGVSHSVLDISLLKSLVAWEPAYTLQGGVVELCRRKRKAMRGHL